MSVDSGTRVCEGQVQPQPCGAEFIRRPGSSVEDFIRKQEGDNKEIKAAIQGLLDNSENLSDRVKEVEERLRDANKWLSRTIWGGLVAFLGVIPTLATFIWFVAMLGVDQRLNTLHSQITTESHDSYKSERTENTRISEALRARIDYVLDIVIAHPLHKR
jgi:hypothetical protein